MANAAPLILHIEDEQDIQETTKRALDAIGGLSIVQCSSGCQALEVVAKYAPDLFLLDVTMPKLDGIETLRRLREIPGFDQTPAIFMTEKVTHEDQEMFMNCGAYSIIKKPLNPTTVASEIVDVWTNAFQARVANPQRH